MTTWTKRTKPSTSYTERTKLTETFTWDDMTMTWDNATKTWEQYYDQFIRRSETSTNWTERIKP